MEYWAWWQCLAGKRRVTVNLGVSGVAAHTKKITIQHWQAMIPLSWKTTFVVLFYLDFQPFKDNYIVVSEKGQKHKELLSQIWFSEGYNACVPSVIRTTNSSIKPIKSIVKDPTELWIVGFYRIIFTGDGHSLSENWDSGFIPSSIFFVLSVTTSLAKTT